MVLGVLLSHHPTAACRVQGQSLFGLGYGMHHCRSRGHSPPHQAWNPLLIIKGTCSNCENGLLNHIPLEGRARERVAPCEGIPHFNESPVSPASGNSAR
ncbi:uncharacterized [Tachysurus ichikawai]